MSALQLKDLHFAATARPGDTAEMNLWAIHAELNCSAAPRSAAPLLTRAGETILD
jgi:hypothetical protein